MKRTLFTLVSLVIVACTALCLAACGGVDAEGVWENATYLKDAELGDGDTEISVIVEAGDSSVTFTVHTDATTLADALVAHGIIAGEQTEYGLTVYTVNGMRADWNTDGAYWALYIGDDYAMDGVSYIEIADGEVYRFVYSAA